MKFKGLATRMRGEFLNDTEGSREEDYRWKTTELFAALHAAQIELCKRRLLLFDAETASICQFTVAAVDGVFPRSYGISDKILRVEQLRFPSVPKPLDLRERQQLTAEEPDWEDRIGTPSAFCLDLSMGRLTFNRQPIFGGVVRMAVKRLPLLEHDEITPDTTPEVKQLDDTLIHGALKFAYLKDDLRTYDPARSATWAGVFEKDINQIILDQAAFNPKTSQMKPERF